MNKGLFQGHTIHFIMNKKGISTCVYCEKKFTRMDNMQKHVRRVHKQEPEMSKHSLKCLGNNCSKVCQSMKTLRRHIECEHNVSLSTEELSFDTFEGKLLFVLDVVLHFRILNPLH